MAASPQPISSPEVATALRDFMLAAFREEYPLTRKVTAKIKDGDWKPDPKARTASELAWHIVTSDIWFLNSVADGVFSPDTASEQQPATVAKILEWYEQRFPAAAARLEKLKPDQLTAIVDFFGMKFPNVSYLKFGLAHAIHHRGQLATYLRPLGGKVPDIYGGSADEPWQG